MTARQAGAALGAVVLAASASIMGAAHAAGALPCTAADLTARVTGGGAGMSQPAVYVTVTNTSTKACSLDGYPRITGAWTVKGPQHVSVKDGAVMNAPATKPKAIIVQPKGHAWFAIGAGTAYDPPLVTFERISVAPSSMRASFTVRHLGLQATAPKGQPFPLGVTAFAAGSAPAS